MNTMKKKTTGMGITKMPEQYEAIHNGIVDLLSRDHFSGIALHPSQGAECPPHPRP